MIEDKDISLLTPEGKKKGWYRSYGKMMERCYYKKGHKYHIYGARGITVCLEWYKKPRQFYRDMGERPEGMTLDRMDNDLGYSAENCRWATNQEQSQNKAGTVLTAPKVLAAQFLKEMGWTYKMITENLLRDNPPRERKTLIKAVKGITWSNVRLPE